MRPLPSAPLIAGVPGETDWSGDKKGVADKDQSVDKISVLRITSAYLKFQEFLKKEHVCKYVYVCMYVCMCVCMYVCACVCVCHNTIVYQDNASSC